MTTESIGVTGVAFVYQAAADALAYQSRSYCTSVLKTACQLMSDCCLFCHAWSACTQCEAEPHFCPESQHDLKKKKKITTCSSHEIPLKGDKRMLCMAA